jgi:colicin import membrane protein
VINPRPITPLKESVVIQKPLKTLKTSKSIRQFQREYLSYPSLRKLQKHFRANEALAAQSSIQSFRADRLETALKIEKKKRTRGKRLGLIGKEVVGAQLYGVKEIEEARQFQAAQEAKKEAIQAEKEKEKVDKAVKKALDQQREEEKQAQMEIDLQLKRDTEVQRKAQKAAAKEEVKANKKVAAQLKSTQTSMPKSRKGKVLAIKAKSKSVKHIEVIEPEEVVEVTKSGRIMKLPQRFKES